MPKPDKSRFEVVPINDALVERLRGRLRQADNVEVTAAFGHSADEGLDNAVEYSERAYVMLDNGEPIIAFGVAPYEAQKGSPWLLATPAIEDMDVAMYVLRHSRGYVDEFLVLFEELENWVHAENLVSLRWLEWLGFDIDTPAPWGVSGDKFCRVFRRRVCASR